MLLLSIVHGRCYAHWDGHSRRCLSRAGDISPSLVRVAETSQKRGSGEYLSRCARICARVAIGRGTRTSLPNCTTSCLGSLAPQSRRLSPSLCSSASRGTPLRKFLCPLSCLLRSVLGAALRSEPARKVLRRSAVRGVGVAGVVAAGGLADPDPTIGQRHDLSGDAAAWRPTYGPIQV